MNKEEIVAVLTRLIAGADDCWRALPEGQDVIARAEALIKDLEADPRDWRSRVVFGPI